MWQEADGSVLLSTSSRLFTQMAPYTAAVNTEILASSRRERRCQMWQEADDGVLLVRLGGFLSQMAPYTHASTLI